jgi:hypothetical protein
LLGQVPSRPDEQGAIALGIGGCRAGLSQIAVRAGCTIDQMLDERAPVLDQRIGWSSDGSALVGPTTRLLAWWGLHSLL